MDDDHDFQPASLLVGALVRYREYYYFPDTYVDREVGDGDVGIVVGVDTTYMGYTVYRVFWFKQGIVQTVPRPNLKLAYLRKEI